MRKYKHHKIYYIKIFCITILLITSFSEKLEDRIDQNSKLKVDIIDLNWLVFRTIFSIQIRAYLDLLVYHFRTEAKRLRNELLPVGNIVGGNTILTVSAARRHFPSCFRETFLEGRKLICRRKNSMSDSAFTTR